MNDLANIPGLYGKIPVLGDFVTRRLTSRFVETWDQWLQGALTVSREQLGDRWLDSYLTSPIWHFLLSPGICGKDAWAGILMPSVDKVGRYFPLTFAVSIGPGYQLPAVFSGAAAWFEQMEQLALSILEDDLDLVELDRKLQTQTLGGSEVFAAKAVGHIEYASQDGKFNFHASMDTLEQINDAFVQLGYCLLSDQQPTYSLWCTNGSESMPPCLRVYNHLPPRDAFFELLIGQATLEAEGDFSENASPTIAAKDYQSACVEPFADVIGISRFQWHSCAVTTAGKCRKVNEDAFLERPEIGLWVVADGMGGHSAGDVASKAVIDALGTLMPSGNLNSFTAYATECLRTVNAELLKKAAQLGQGQIIGTTVVVMLAVGERCAVIWAGDSRLYQYRNGRLTQLTSDHSLAGELLQQEGAVPDDRDLEKAENIVTRALGAGLEILLDVITFTARDGDIYLLCSDGLVKEVNHREISNVLQNGGCRQSAQALIDLALARGARDNVTVVVAQAGHSETD